MADKCSNASDADEGAGGIMLFGVKLVVGRARKEKDHYPPPPPPPPPQHQEPAPTANSSNNSENAAASAYASTNDAVRRSPRTSTECKRGVPWTEEEHRWFLFGLEKVGKRDWKAISRDFVKTRSPTQVASHAQKYFLRRTNFNHRRRHRPSIFDITTDDHEAVTPREEDEADGELQRRVSRPCQAESTSVCKNAVVSLKRPDSAFSDLLTALANGDDTVII